MYNFIKKTSLLFKTFHNISQLCITSSKTLKKSFLSLEVIILYNQINSSDLSFMKYLFAGNEKYTAPHQTKGS